MTELALRKEEEQALLAQLENMDLSVAGEENLQPGDIGMPPRLRISQPNRPITVGEGAAPAGTIVNTVTGEVAEALDIAVLVFLPRTRVLWPAEFATTNDPECLSDDGDYPAENSDMRKLSNPRSGPCATCPMAQWSEEGVPPRCKVQRNFLVMVYPDDGDPEPAILPLQSTAIKSARQLTSLAKTQKLRKTVRFMTSEVKDERGMWYVPLFGKGRKLEPAEIMALVEARDELRELIITADVSEEMRENGVVNEEPERERSEGAKALYEDEIPF
jgi:hypothetical protein